ncbi:lamin tail domain-containing protein [Ammoniphilus sp. CFH 90114]|uniref:metallophosphoesterase n=1 Tax=Ammoniphilus sp. CFH 90114 TaxID=2493665 RepID=UPI00100DD77F|nr:lamin tail domain-containing protein [Ammoniphilus sp. CFH 90114]RXT02362.1 metallophosphoesterase [Ammoniphilus sp. CFH 90114]
MKRRWLSSLLSVTLLSSSVLNVAYAREGSAQSSSPVFLTEIYPDDKSNSHISGAGSNDLFEFIEIYNNAGESLAFNDHYKIRYNYNTNVKDLRVTDVVYADQEQVTIPANSPAVLWVERTSSKITEDANNLTEADFRQYHAVPDHVPVFRLRGQDGLNNTDRGFYITQKSDNNAILSEIYYTADDVGDGKSLHLKVPATGIAMVKHRQEASPTAGVVELEQLQLQEPNQSPVITHQPMVSVEGGQPVKVTATVIDPEQDTLTVKLYYKSSINTPYHEARMESDGTEGQYAFTIPAGELTGERIYYYLEASDQVNLVKSEDYEIPVGQPPAGGTAPRVLITELLPNPAGDYRKGSGNQYEYLELYNNSDEVLNLKGYTLFYLYPGTTKPKKWTIPSDTAIQPYHSAVIWFAREAIADGFTSVDDFNTHFNTVLQENDVIFYDNRSSDDFNLPNSLQRGFALSSTEDLKDTIVEAWYDPSTPTSPDRLVNDVRNAVVRFTYSTSGTRMERLDTRAYGTPGSVEVGQVPPVEGIDMVAPTLQYHQSAYTVGKSKPYNVKITSNEPLSRAEVLYGPSSSGLNELTHRIPLELKTTSGSSYVYEGTIREEELGDYRYIVEAEDEAGHRTRVPYNSRGSVFTVVESELDTTLPEPGLSMKNGEILSGKAELFAYGRSSEDQIDVLFDGQSLNLRPALPGQAQFLFQARGIDQIYQTSASAKAPNGEGEFFGRVLPKYVEGAWHTFDLSPRYFVSASTVSIHSGNENVPYDLSTHELYFNKTNFDDLEVKNIHLILPDGTMIKPDQIQNFLGDLSRTTVEYKENTYYGLGDGSAPNNTNMKKPLISEFEFAIPAEKYLARYAELDTAALTDGTYSLTMSLKDEVIETINVTVDNTKPIIDGVEYAPGQMIAPSMKLKGSIRMEAVASDNLTGIVKVEGKLDGKPIAFPYETSSATLASGEHTIEVTVYDGAGNQATERVKFQIEEEKPNEPSQVLPSDLATGVDRNTRLQATVTDPTADSLKVEFLEATKYDFARNENISGFVHVADREPPLTVAPAGESEMSAEAATKVARPDGEYLWTDTQAGFPYHRFEVELTEDQLHADSTVELYWKGKTLPGRIVTLYAWDHNEEKWIALKSTTGDSTESEIVLSADIDAARFVKDNKIQAMVQDEVKQANEPFTLLWVSDTQYYAESYPDVFDTLGDWMVDEYNQGKFEYVIHTGDLVNRANIESQWEVADRNMKKLDDAGVPYGVLAGNHDVITNGLDYTMYGKYFGSSRFSSKPWYGGEMDNNRNHYDLISFGGHDFIMLYLGFGTEDTQETINWANEVLKKHADRMAIIGMHAYLENNATLSKMAQNVFDQIVEPNENVRMVLCGHYHGANRKVKTLTNKDGSTRQVVEMLADYQEGPNGGDGYVRLLQFDPVSGLLDVDTYSPYKDDYNYFDEGDIDDFTLDFQFRDINKRVATDYFAVNVYHSNLIGSVEDVVSGTTVSTPWNDLNPGQTYYWYMSISDDYGAKRRSAIYGFTTQDSTSVLSLAGPSQVQAGQEVHMSIQLQNVQDLYGAALTLNYDPQKLQGIEILPSEWLTGAEITNEIDSTQGLVRFAVTKLGVTEGVYGTGTLDCSIQGAGFRLRRSEHYTGGRENSAGQQSQSTDPNRDQPIPLYRRRF